MCYLTTQWNNHNSIPNQVSHSESSLINSQPQDKTHFTAHPNFYDAIDLCMLEPLQSILTFCASHIKGLS